MTPHVKAQLWRFARLFVLAYVPLALALARWDGKALLGLTPPALEVVWRAIFPAVPTPSQDS